MRTPLSRWLCKQLGLLGCVLLAGLSGGRVRAQELFLPARPDAPAALTNAIAKRSRPVAINHALLDGLDTTLTHTLQITLFDNARTTATLDRCLVRGTRNYTWFGAVPGLEFSSLQLTVNGDSAIMILALPGKGTYITRYGANGLAYLIERDPAKRGHCGGALPLTFPDNPVPDPGPAGGFGVAAVNVIDVCVFYTVQTRNDQGGANNVVTLAQASVDQTNDAMSDSNGNTMLRLTAVRELTNFTETNNDYSGTLNRFRNDSAANYERELQGADLCCLLVSGVENHSGGSYTDGIAYLLTKSSGAESTDPSPPTGSPDYGFSVVYDNNADDLTFAHEIGHNLGCGHSLNEDSHNGCFSFSHGYRFVANGSIRYHTVMAYGYSYLGFSATHVGRYSNPDYTYGGTHYGDAATADNARTIRLTAYAVAHYRDPAIFVDNQADNTQDGTQLHPYRSVAAAIATVPVGNTTPVNIFIAGRGSIGYNSTGLFNRKVNLRLWFGSYALIGRP